MRSKFLLTFFVFITLSLATVYYLLVLKQLDIANEKNLLAAISSQQKLIRENPEHEELYLTALYEMLGESSHLIIITDLRGNKVFSSKNLSNLNFSAESEDLIKQKPLILELDRQNLLLYYQASPWLQQLAYFPVVQALLLILVLLLFYFLYNLGKRNEQNLIWVGMAKETAHQLGTPVTSLSGWKDYIEELSTDQQDLKIIADGLDEDLKRMNLVISRFSLVASKPEMSFHNLKKLLIEVADYISRRLPLQDPKIEIKTSDIEETGDIFMNPLLLSWALENVIKNAIQAIPNRQIGLINISSVTAKNRILVEITDNGCGLKSRHFKEIFKTGYTTKKRGWGIGLSLARRVIEEYHQGRILVKESQIGHGTTIRIELNRLV